MSLNEEVELLRNIPMFANIEPSKLKLLAFTSERMAFKDGDVLFRQGEQGDSAYVIIGGEADVIVDTPKGPLTVAKLKRNDIVGEIAILCDVPRTATVKAATNAQQWYVTISRGRRGIRIFTPDKEQLRENVMRSGHRPLAMELVAGFIPRRGVRLWDRLHGHLLRFGPRAADTFCRLKLARRRHLKATQKHEHKNTRMLVERPERSRRQNRTVG